MRPRGRAGLLQFVSSYREVISQSYMSDRSGAGKDPHGDC